MRYSYSAEEQIHDLLERRNPNEYDRFRALLDSLFRDILPSLRRILAAYGDTFDTEELISKALEKALTCLHAQYFDLPTNYVFGRSHDIRFLTWIMNIVGKPGAGRRSGLVGAEIKKRSREQSRLQHIDEQIESLPQHNAQDIEQFSFTLDKAVSSLDAREQFIIRTEFAFHSHKSLTPTTIKDLALSSGFHKTEAEQIHNRALSIVAQKPDTEKLKQSQISNLLSLSERQVYNIKKKALVKMREVSELTDYL